MSDGVIIFGRVLNDSTILQQRRESAVGKRVHAPGNGRGVSGCGGDECMYCVCVCDVYVCTYPVVSPGMYLPEKLRNVSRITW